MKTLFLSILMVLFVGSMQAQPTTSKNYADSLYYTATPSEASNLAWLTLGYGKSINLRNDTRAYKDKILCVKFAKITDSIRIYGGSVNFGVDTTWHVLTLPVLELSQKVGLYTVAGVVVPQALRDTTVTWLSPKGTDQHTFMIDMSRYIFPAYKIRMGVFDTGKVYIQDIRRGGY